MPYCSWFVFVNKKILVYSLHFIASIVTAFNESLTRVVMYIYSVKTLSVDYGQLYLTQGYDVAQ